MKISDYISLMREALISHYGIAIRYNDDFLSRYVRQNLYRARSALRAKGDHQYDGLSFIVTADGDLQLVKRKILPRMKNDDLEKPYTQLLRQEELPNFIGSRGKAKRKQEQKLAFL